MKIRFAIVFAALFLPLGVPAQSIRSVDFMNFTYKADYCGFEGKETSIAVKDGKFYREESDGEYVDRIYYAVEFQAYGDLDGDGKEEAVISSVCSTGGTGNFSEAYIYSMRNGNAERVHLIAGGDRAYGGFHDLRIEDGLLVIESYDPGEMGGACCAELIVTNKYKLRNSKLTEVGSRLVREIYPATKVYFKKGSYSASFPVELTLEQDQKRFKVSAAKGQRMRIQTDSPNARIRLRSGEAVVVEEGSVLTADLTENGEFIFEFLLMGEQPASFIATVTIK